MPPSLAMIYTHYKPAKKAVAANPGLLSVWGQVRGRRTQERGVRKRVAYVFLSGVLSDMLLFYRK